jgi:hypothetical protein
MKLVGVQLHDITEVEIMKIGLNRIIIGSILFIASIIAYPINSHVDCSSLEHKELLKYCNDFQDKNYVLVKIIPIILGCLMIGISFINPNNEKQINRSPTTNG